MSNDYIGEHVLLWSHTQSMDKDEDPGLTFQQMRTYQSITAPISMVINKSIDGTKKKTFNAKMKIHLVVFYLTTSTIF